MGIRLLASVLFSFFLQIRRHIFSSLCVFYRQWMTAGVNVSISGSVGLFVCVFITGKWL